MRYIVPHEIDQERLGQGEIRLQLRVKAPIESPAWVEVRSNGQLVTRANEPYARPGEMITVTLTPRQYDDVLHASELVVAVIKK